MMVVRNFRPDFSEFKTKLKTYSNMVGFPIDGKMTPRILFHLLNNNFWTKLAFACFGFQAWYEHSHGRGFLYGDVTFLTGLVICWSALYAANILFLKRLVLAELLDWCENLYRKSEHSSGLILEDMGNDIHKVIRFVKIMCWLKWIFHMQAAILSKLFAEEALVASPIYTIHGVVQQFPWYHSLFVIHVFLIVYVHGTIRASASVYVVISKHIVAQFDYALEIIRKMDAGDSGAINRLVKLHADLLKQVEGLSDMFSIPMLLVEMSAMANFVLFGLMVVRRSEYHMLIVNFFDLSTCALYSHFGQLISDRAADLSDELYACPWLEMKTTNRKKIQLLIQMANKATGINAGGFHFISYSQYMDVSALF